MSSIKYRKIKKIVNWINGFQPIASIKNFKLEKENKRVIGIDYLTNKKVYPFCFDFQKKVVGFIETESIVNHNEASFFFEALKKKAKYFIEVKLGDFHELCQKMRRLDDNKLIFINHPGRCGSTLLHKMFGSNRMIESFSEDLIFENVMSSDITSRIGKEYAGKLIKDIIQLAFSKWIENNDKRLSYKFTGYCVQYTNQITNIFPNAKQFYLTRTPVKIVQSYINLFRLNWTYNLLMRFGYPWLRLYPYKIARKKVLWPDHLNKGKRIDANQRKMRLSQAEMILLQTMIIDRCFVDKNSENLMILNYAELIDQNNIYRRLSKFLKIDGKSFINKNVFNTHSQKNSFIDLKKMKRISLTDKQIHKLSEFESNIRGKIDLC